MGPKMSRKGLGHFNIPKSKEATETSRVMPGLGSCRQVPINKRLNELSFERRTVMDQNL